MRQSVVLTGFVTGVLSLMTLSPSVWAGDADSQTAQVWLKKIQTAAQKLNYSGTFVYQQGNLVRTSRIAHIVQGHDETEKLETLDGTPREYIRNNDDIVYYVPETRTLLVEKRVTQEVFPAILAASAGDIAAYYDVRKEGAGRVAGIECQSIALQPKDGFRYGYRLWADKKSGLLLRAQTLNENAEVIEQIAFTEIAIGNIDRSRVKASIENTEGWHVENALMSQGHFTNWTIRSVPPGFRKIREVRRMVSGNARPVQGSLSAGQREVSQIVFSDGLAAISVFVEPGTPRRTEGAMQQGAMNIIGKRQGDFWLTVVGEVPSAAIRLVANSVEFKSR